MKKSSKLMSAVVSSVHAFIFSLGITECLMWEKHENDRNDYKGKLMRWINGLPFFEWFCCVYQVTLLNCPSFPSPFLSSFSRETESIYWRVTFLLSHAGHSQWPLLGRIDRQSVSPHLPHSFHCPRVESDLFFLSSSFVVTLLVTHSPTTLMQSMYND